MSNGYKSFFNEIGINENQLVNRLISIEIDSSGKQQAIETIAEEMELLIDEGEEQNFSAIEIISVAGSLITIIDFLLKLKKKFGSSLFIRLKNKNRRFIELTVDDALNRIVKDNQK